MSPSPPIVDRAGAVRAALRRLVARHGFHGASMSAVAREAGVATGTAYVHYASKEELILATYVEVKQQLGQAAAASADEVGDPHERFADLWLGAYWYLAEDADRARFLLQVENSPYADVAHERAMDAGDDPLSRAVAAPDLAGRLADLPPLVLYDLGLGPAVRLAAGAHRMDESHLREVVECCWRAVIREP